jgi:acetyltransferase-like isoleucine patch superfamily enzyme
MNKEIDNYPHARPPKRPLFKSLFRKIRMSFLLRFRYRFLSAGKDFYIGRNTLIRPKSVSVGDFSYIGNNCHIASQVTIGNWVMIASNASMVGGDHVFNTAGIPSIWAGRDINRKIIIEDDAWIGHGAIIMHGVHIGEGAIVAAGSVVTKDIKPYAVVAGVPAKVLRDRFTDEQRQLHQEELAKLREKYCG